MISTMTLPSLSTFIVGRVRDCDRRLRQSPFYTRLLAGELDRDEYAAWLVQMHKYIRSIERIYMVGARAMEAAAKVDERAAKVRDYAAWVVKEEAGHDDLIVQDLAALWDVSQDEALGRLARTPAGPSCAAWDGMTDLMLARYPQGLLGFAVALESFALLHTDEIRKNTIAQGQILLVENAVAFLAAHSGENEAAHTKVGRESVDLLIDPVERAAALFYAQVGIAMFEGIAQYLTECFDAVREPELAAV
jgi:thiaminase